MCRPAFLAQALKSAGTSVTVIFFFTDDCTKK